MSELSVQFETAAQEVQLLHKRPDNEHMLKLYALYKQATRGDASGKRPGMFDVVGRTKYDAWAALKGLDQAAAQQQYIDLVHELQQAEQG
ncbi:MAG: acyl-CoA-binding protein [Anaerolineales bacterium]|jgi:diazepam-binding inhibitor (GABA receptor modulating acyl-CoA-binding protein)